MVSCRKIVSTLFIVILIIAGVVCWILHSLYFIYWWFVPYSQRTTVARVTNTIQIYPTVIICNTLPLIQSLISQNSALNTPYFERYVNESLNPSIWEQPGYQPFTASYLAQGEQAFAQNFPVYNRVQQLINYMYACQAVISSCVYQNVTYSNTQCCQSVDTVIPTLDGVCWAFRNLSFTTNSSLYDRTIQFNFLISYQNWYSQQFAPIHPGLTVYLLNPDETDKNDLLAGVTYANPVAIRDNQGVRLRVRRQNITDLRRFDCGMITSSYAAQVDINAKQSNQSNFVQCVLMAVIQYCSCHPLWAEFLMFESSINPTQYSQLTSMINASALCGYTTYNTCARPFIEYLKPEQWAEPIIGDSWVVAAISSCRSSQHIPCQRVQYEATPELYPFPPYTNDYTGQLVIGFESLQDDDIQQIREYNIYETLSFIGYNIGLWFSFGHMIWLVALFIGTYICCCCCPNPKGTFSVAPHGMLMNGGGSIAAVDPKQHMMQSRRQQLSPLQANGNHHQPTPAAQDDNEADEGKEDSMSNKEQ